MNTKKPVWRSAVMMLIILVADSHQDNHVSTHDIFDNQDTDSGPVPAFNPLSILLIALLLVLRKR